ncbi:MAG: hypothetical protein WD044_00770 [Dongiaceae bacterium]
MNLAETIGHYVAGALIGIVFATIVAFSTGWVTLTRSMNERIERAQVEAFASICVVNSLAAWASDGKKLEDLAGDSNREREALIELFVPATESVYGLESAIRRACGNIIRARA